MASQLNTLSHPHTQTAGHHVQVLGTSRGLLLSGPGGVVMLTNKTLAAVADFAIALQDLIVPDVDLEANGDEQDGQNSEDEFMHHSLWDGAGGPIADPDSAVDDRPCDACSEDGL